MRIVYFGSADFGLLSLDAVMGSDHELVHIFTQPAHAAGRGRKERPTPVAVWAQNNGVPCTGAENINSPGMVEKVRACNGDLLLVIAFGQKVGNEVIDLHEHKAINVHGSVLPKYRGAAPINWAIVNGEKETGVSIITLAERMDAGEVLRIGRLPIRPWDTAELVYNKLAELSPCTLLDALDDIEAGRAVYTPQDETLVTYAPKMKKSDGCVDFSESAESLSNKVRGFWPWPGVHAEYVCHQTHKKLDVIIGEVEVVGDQANEAQKVGLLDDDLNIICGAGRLQIVKIKPAGKGMMKFKDFVNGHRCKPNDVFKTVETL